MGGVMAEGWGLGFSIAGFGIRVWSCEAVALATETEAGGRGQTATALLL
jgi:hypothetical protein